MRKEGDGRGIRFRRTASFTPWLLLLVKLSIYMDLLSRSRNSDSEVLS